MQSSAPNLCLVRRHPQHAGAHFLLSYVLRFAGLLQESGRQCDIAFSLDPHVQTNVLRTCAIPFLLQGQYGHAAEFLRIDGDSNFAKALSLHILVREGKINDAAQLGAPHIPGWGSYDMLLTCAQHKPEADIEILARNIQADEDPETNYFSATHLAYCGQNAAALQMLKKAIQGNYCSYPAMDSDPFLAGLHQETEWAELRSAAIQCLRKFLDATRNSGQLMGVR